MRYSLTEEKGGVISVLGAREGDIHMMKANQRQLGHFQCVLILLFRGCKRQVAHTNNTEESWGNWDGGEEEERA